ncbi:MAG TPA: NADH-quinone oxidoreductase subunit NuoH [Anaerolineales bacterium]|jgi:NADH-quinone oxidoreductase subunit H|nr:NADH-quinone oxidoreductase subunit NuoH [Anaerolineales bacterium]
MSDPVNSIAEWLRTIMSGWGLSEGLITVILAVLGVVILATFVLIVDIMLVWLERKIVARFQDRFGPNRVGPYGIIQPIADVIKLLIKEDIMPVGADKFIFNLAPIIALATVLLLWAVVPFAPTIIGADINVAVLYVVAIGSIGTLGIIMAGWASNNKYALLGAFRTVAQMIAYEVPMIIALLVPVLLARSMGMQTIVAAQSPWFIFIVPLAAVILFISSIAELGRTPFDISEAESEIVAGFHIEYTGMKFGLFYAGELLHALTVSALIATLFLGGWRGPFVDQVPILGPLYLFAKAFIVYYLIMWIRYSFPRVRIDQMLGFNWKFLTPLALILLIVVAILDKLLVGVPTVWYILVMLGANLLIVLGTVLILKRYAHTERKRIGEERPTAVPPETEMNELVVQE